MEGTQPLACTHLDFNFCDIKLGDLKKNVPSALAGVAQWIECWLANQRVAHSIPSQGTCLGCGPDPQWEACERQPHIVISLPLFHSPFSSL